MTLDGATLETIRRALAEDVGSGDLTTRACIPERHRGGGSLRARAGGVLSGIEVAVAAFHELDDSLDIDVLRGDGAKVSPADDVLRISGALRPILTGERVALNFATHLSGIATLTARYVDAAAGAIKILDTRKTIPGLRSLEKQAVVHGGGTNHRHGLYDAVMIKDNHIAAAGGFEEALVLVRDADQGVHVVLEVTSLDMARRAAELGVKHLLLDNMSLDEIRGVVTALGTERPFLEVSGGVTLESIAGIAATGVDAVSVGALTHSAPALDLALDLDPVGS